LYHIVRQVVEFLTEGVFMFFSACIATELELFV
jgi:hypothetical protein